MNYQSKSLSSPINKIQSVLALLICLLTTIAFACPIEDLARQAYDYDHDGWLTSEGPNGSSCCYVECNVTESEINTWVAAAANTPHLDVTPCLAQQSGNPVKYITGLTMIDEKDVSVGELRHQRHFRNRYVKGGDLEGANGFNWIAFKTAAYIQGAHEESITVVLGSTEHTFLWDGSGYVSQAGYGSLTHDDVNDEIVYTISTSGGDQVETFYDFDAAMNSTGRLKSRTMPNGSVTSVLSYSASGFPEEIQQVSIRGSSVITDSLVYTYYTSGEASGLIQKVAARQDVDSAGWVNLEAAKYTYYDSTSSYGATRDLETATHQVWDGSAWQDHAVTYYRYYKDTEANGFEHALKYVLKPESYRRLSQDAGVSDPLTATNVQVAPYADMYLEYDDDELDENEEPNQFYRAVTKEIATGSCSGCGSTATLAGDSFSYSVNPNYPSSLTQIERERFWKVKAVNTHADGSSTTVYLNAGGDSLLQVREDAGQTQQWLMFWRAAVGCHVDYKAMPSAVSGFDETKNDLLDEVNGNYAYLRDSGGMIVATEYYDETDFENGKLDGLIAYHQYQQGELGTPVKLEKWEYARYTDETSGLVHDYRSKKVIYPDAANEATTIVTSYGYTYYSGTVSIESMTTTLPVVSTSQNGSGVSATTIEYYDEDGQLVWSRDERGVIGYREYDSLTGQVSKVIRDVDTSLVSNEPSGWSTPAGDRFGNHQITEYEYDQQGRLIQTLGPAYEALVSGSATTVRQATWTVTIRNGSLADDESWHASGYATGTSPSYTYTLIDPVTISKRDKEGRAVERIVSERTSGSGKLSATDTFARSDWHRWTTTQFNDLDLKVSERVYHTIPSSGDGSEGTNYDETEFGYDSIGRLIRSESPGGTILRAVLNIRGDIVSQWVGTDDSSATGSDPTGGSASGNNMVKVVEYEYDDGNDGGDGNRTKATAHVDGSTTRVTNYAYDWRSRLVAEDGEIDRYTARTYDNLNRVIKVENYDISSSGNLIAKAEMKYDDQGRAYETLQYAVDPSTGSVGNALVSRTWYDEVGLPIKSMGAGTGEELFQKISYDGLGRVSARYVGFDTDESSYSEAESVTGDTIIRQSIPDYDSAGNTIVSNGYERFHDDTSTTGELDNSSARPSYGAMWYDGGGRQIAAAAYGTNGGASFTRPSTVPARSDIILVNEVHYGGSGSVSRQIDSGEQEVRFVYDDAGRPISKIENYVDGDPTTGSVDEDRVSDRTYTADGGVATLTARQPNPSDDQTTVYVYGTTLADSGAATSNRLRATIYPDSDDIASPLGNGTDSTYDRVELKYDRQGAVVERKDQNGTIHSYEYDALGRAVADTVTTLGTGIDGDIRKIVRTYDVRGLVTAITSYDTISSGNIVNEVKTVYNDFGQLLAEYQSHSGSVNTSTTPKVQYGYADGSNGHVRPTSMTYPDGRVIDYDYGSGDGVNDLLGRIQSIKDGTTVLASYTYLGAATVIRVDYEEPDVRLDLWGGTSGTYAGMDRFDRTVDHRWYDYGSSSDAVRVAHAYDRESNRLYREDLVADSYSGGFDAFYSYDDLNRLVSADQGDLNGSKDAIGTLAFAQSWELSPVGNWSTYDQDSNGDGDTTDAGDLDQSRTHNLVNELTAFSEAGGQAAWADPAYDRVGNMTTIPRPGDMPNTYVATYDAWNRLAKLTDGTDTVAEYEYDSQKRRIVKKLYDAGVLDETEHHYYNTNWQLIEVRLGSSPATTDPVRQYVWGDDYLDSLICRDRDTDGNGTLDETIYTLQDANYNLAAAIGTDGTVVERYHTTPYGQRSVLDANFAADADGQSDIGMSVGHQGLFHDAETGLLYNRERYLHSDVGRFVSRDPLGYIDGPNIHQYVRSQPVNRRDPLGLDMFDDAAGAGGLGNYIPPGQSPDPRGPRDPFWNDGTFNSSHWNSRNYYNHYLGGSGTAVRIPFSSIDTSAVKATDFDDIQTLLQIAHPGEYRISDSRLVFATSGDQAAYLGQITLKLQGTLWIRGGSCNNWEFEGVLKSFDDRYDFNVGAGRGLQGEILTTLGNVVGRLRGARSYWVEVRGAKDIAQSGDLDRIPSQQDHATAGYYYYY